MVATLQNWEIILVDNNSSDGTDIIAKEFWIKQENEAPLIIVKEPRAGLSFAREAGISRASSEILVFCDDDNWLFPEYLEKAFSIMTNNPSIAVLGGQGYVRSEIPVPQIIEPFLDQYAIGPQGLKSGDVTESKGYVYGAGMIIRKSYFKELKESGFTFSLSGRKGKGLNSGEDFELCIAFAARGRKIWYDDQLKFYHFLTKERLNLPYLISMNQGFGYSLAFLLPYIYNKGFRDFRALKFNYFYTLFKHLLIFSQSWVKKQMNHEIALMLEFEKNKGLLNSLIKNRKILSKRFNDL